ncbi:MAG TPA: glutaminase A [Candidatus Nanopelagicales bacterium]|nr:glutaminase A [Candidatus Nanopelagicales bacterium]
MGGTSTGPIEQLLDEVWTEASRLDGGEVATYIPELAKADPAVFGLGLATLDGQVYTAGTLVPFTIQSVSKPYVYALALADRGTAAVEQRVGAEPTGDPFNSIALDATTGRASNPMVNAGAIVTSSLVGGTDRAAQFERILGGLSAFAGRNLLVDEEVYVSERDTGDRNRAIAYFMRSAGLLDEDVDAQVELYFRQCAVLVTARDLAVMAATLANAGVNPVTGEQVVPRHVVPLVLTVMATCGMYDYAGEWLYRVGLPAKSGVSGGVSAALPGQLGLGLHSPLLDARGNSVRGVAAAQLLSERLGMHMLLPSERQRSGLRRTYRADAVRSRRGRPRAHREVLDAHASTIVVHELVGDEGFASTEMLVRAVLSDPVPARWRVLDLRRVTRIDTAAETLLASLVAQLEASGVTVSVVEPRLPQPKQALRWLPGSVHRFLDADAALERSETALLHEQGLDDDLPVDLVPLTGIDLLDGMPDWAVRAIEERVTTRVITDGAVVFDEGDPADGLYLVAAGQVASDVRMKNQSGRRRLSTMAAGASFGELALVDGSTRSTRIVALEPTICYVLGPDAFDELRHRDPASAAELVMAIARSLSHRLRSSTADVAAFEDL